MKRVSSADLHADIAAVMEMSRTESVQIVNEDGTDGITIHCRRPLLGTVCSGCGTYHEDGCELVAEILALREQIAEAQGIIESQGKEAAATDIELQELRNLAETI